VHEGAHAEHYYSMNVTGSNHARNSVDLTELGNLCQQDLSIVYEEFRKNDDSAVALLRSLQQKYKAAHFGKQAAAVGKVIAAFGKRNGLQAIGVTEPSDESFFQCQSNGIDMMIQFAGGVQPDGKFLDLVPKAADGTPLVDISDLIAANVELDKWMRLHFKDIAENGTLAQLSTPGGHPGDNASEFFASTVASCMAGPDEVIQDVLALPPERRRIRISEINLVARILLRNDPTLWRVTNVGRVARDLRMAA